MKTKTVYCPICGDRIINLLFKQKGETIKTVTVDHWGDLQYDAGRFYSNDVGKWVCPHCDQEVGQSASQVSEVLNGKVQSTIPKPPHAIQSYGRIFTPMKWKNVESYTTDDKYYQVTLWDNGRYTCTCPSFVKSEKQYGRDIWAKIYCKHIEDIRENGWGD